MNVPIKTYRASGKTSGLVFLFKYDLNGQLKGFEIDEGTLEVSQIQWLFMAANFPATEAMMKTVWMKDRKYLDKFNIEFFMSDLSFESAWALWGLKIKKEAAEIVWKKLSEANRIKFFLTAPKYLAHIARTRENQAHFVTWVNQKRYNDEYK